MINTELLTSNGAALDTGAPAPAQETQSKQGNGATAVGTANIAATSPNNTNVANMANMANVAGMTRVELMKTLLMARQ